MARLCGIPVEYVRADEKPEVLASLLSDWDILDFILEVEGDTGRSLDSETGTMPLLFGERFFCWFKKAGATSFGCWALDFSTWACGTAEVPQTGLFKGSHEIQDDGRG